jgi:hypothetical protein
MRPLDLNIKHRLMEISLPPRFLQQLHLIIVQPPASLIFQLFPTDLRANLLGFLVLVFWFEARLHAHAHFCGWRDLIRVAANRRRRCISINAEICVAHRAEGEEARLRFGGQAFEGFFGRDRFAGC